MPIAHFATFSNKKEDIKISKTSSDIDFPIKNLVKQDLKNLLKDNEVLINSSKHILKKVFENIILHDKIIFLCDKNGYIINIVGEIDVFQRFFERGFKLGTSMSYESCGRSAVGEVLRSEKMSIVNAQQHYCKSLTKWTCIAAPIHVADTLQGIICISLKIDEKINHCKIVLELISDFVTSLLIQGDKTPTDKLLFFGALILDERIGLTPREIEVLYWLKLGEPISKLSAKMLLSPNTIKSHMKNIYSKLEVNSLENCIRAIDEILENT